MAFGDEGMGIQQQNGEEKQCLFCYIVAGKLQIKKVYEDDKCIAILDIKPATKGHTILIPKKHYELLILMEEKEVQHLFQQANKLAAILLETMNAQGVNLLVADGPAAGQKAPHALVHIIPRFEHDDVSITWKPKEAKEEELNHIQEAILKKTVFMKKKDEIPIIKKEGFTKKEENIDEFFRRMRRIP